MKRQRVSYALQPIATAALPPTKWYPWQRLTPGARFTPQVSSREHIALLFWTELIMVLSAKIYPHALITGLFCLGRMPQDMSHLRAGMMWMWIQEGLTARDQVMCDLAHLFSAVLRGYWPAVAAATAAAAAGTPRNGAACACDPAADCSCSSMPIIPHLRLANLPADVQAWRYHSNIHWMLQMIQMKNIASDDYADQCDLNHFRVTTLLIFSRFPQ